eukprot:359062-Chlamydomonas_euryale.AAC.13
MRIPKCLPKWTHLHAAAEGTPLQQPHPDTSPTACLIFTSPCYPPIAPETNAQRPSRSRVDHRQGCEEWICTLGHREKLRGAGAMNGARREWSGVCAAARALHAASHDLRIRRPTASATAAAAAAVLCCCCCSC